MMQLTTCKHVGTVTVSIETHKFVVQFYSIRILKLKQTHVPTVIS
jgi:hypothetical protein